MDDARRTAAALAPQAHDEGHAHVSHAETLKGSRTDVNASRHGWVTTRDELSCRAHAHEFRAEHTRASRALINDGRAEAGGSHPFAWRR